MNGLIRTLPRDAGDAPAAARVVLRSLDNLRHGRLELTAPNGERLSFAGPDPGPAAQLELRDWRALSWALARGECGFAEGYRAGLWDTPDPGALITLAAQNQDALEAAVNGRFWHRWLGRLFHALRRNSRRGSRRNIQAHYDLGNDFYHLWLDDELNYSSGLFDGTDDLAAAQHAKNERILERLGVCPGDHLLEIGCGWGAFAAHAARSRGCRVTGITLSEAQLQWAQERIRRSGLEDRVTLELCDYRDVDGSFDHVVSIEMFEAVGEAWWPTYFDALRSRLRPGGGAIVQTITIGDEHFDAYRREADFIQQYIFPGGMLASPSALEGLTRDAGLRITGRRLFGGDYARTLGLWRQRFDASVERIRTLGYDEGFIRLWRFYLAYCEAGFRIGRTDVAQLELAHA